MSNAPPGTGSISAITAGSNPPANHKAPPDKGVLEIWISNSQQISRLQQLQGLAQQNRLCHIDFWHSGSQLQRPESTQLRRVQEEQNSQTLDTPPQEGAQGVPPTGE
eukprot:CAMPEP_0204346368 /NCGR_PEP_ID=MMETSP0469-20131031/27118_1 /ASSEMBLY_ACC=CAM_ASM_000384 /TAXON_ID=2969 /ORGANISM="Oxyrrhis marina" /LENGTH=106 /DNA_ID=CAMNT_0051331973 /DNA_START=508 /DNA_END=829 /DNA_ORIENTATION=-